LLFGRRQKYLGCEVAGRRQGLKVPYATEEEALFLRPSPK
jgi:hypothetical protein